LRQRPKASREPLNQTFGRAMNELLRELRLQHANLRLVLAHLESLRAALQAEPGGSRDALALALDYMRIGPELSHHVNEELICNAIAQQQRPLRAEISAITEEHGTFDQRLRLLGQRLRKDSSDALIQALDAYLGDYARHMEIEESLLFPLAADTLASEDWSAIAQQWVHSQDPVFGPHRSARFLPLSLAVHRR